MRVKAEVVMEFDTDKLTDRVMDVCGDALQTAMTQIIMVTFEDCGDIRGHAAFYVGHLKEEPVKH